MIGRTLQPTRKFQKPDWLAGATNGSQGSQGSHLAESSWQTPAFGYALPKLANSDLSLSVDTISESDQEVHPLKKVVPARTVYITV
jgi:hypothetical protein